MIELDGIRQFIAAGGDVDAKLEDGRAVTLDMFRSMLSEEMDKIASEAGADQSGPSTYSQAADLFAEIIAADSLAEFLTLGAYEHLQG